MIRCRLRKPRMTAPLTQSAISSLFASFLTIFFTKKTAQAQTQTHWLNSEPQSSDFWSEGLLLIGGDTCSLYHYFNVSYFHSAPSHPPTHLCQCQPWAISWEKPETPQKKKPAACNTLQCFTMPTCPVSSTQYFAMPSTQSTQSTQYPVSCNDARSSTAAQCAHSNEGEMCTICT